MSSHQWDGAFALKTAQTPEVPLSEHETFTTGVEKILGPETARGFGIYRQVDESFDSAAPDHLYERQNGKCGIRSDAAARPGALGGKNHTSDR
jgi:hypothetical protein